MSESVTQPDPDQPQEETTQLERDEEPQMAQEDKIPAPASAEEPPVTSTNNIIWTPRFLLTFAITLILGLSLDSLLASGWSTNLFAGLGQWFLLGHIVLTLLGWLTLGIVTRSRWIRIGCLFGGICAAFLTFNLFANLSGINPNSPAQAYINVASCTALLGAYVGLSIEGTLLSAWDFWLFFLVTCLGCVGVALTYLLTPQASIITIENAVAATALIAACLFWWARPSCWKSCPGPTLIFGVVPAILLAMAFMNGSMHYFFLLQVLTSHISPYANINNFFFAQFVLLCLLLGCMRLIQNQRVNSIPKK